jgi:hypothetical protein
MRIIQETDSKFDITTVQTTTNSKSQAKSLSPTRRIKSFIPSTTKNVLAAHNKNISLSVYQSSKHLRGSTIELTSNAVEKQESKLSSEKNSTPQSRSNSKSRGISIFQAD